MDLELNWPLKNTHKGRGALEHFQMFIATAGTDQYVKELINRGITVNCNTGKMLYWILGSVCSTRLLSGNDCTHLQIAFSVLIAKILMPLHTIKATLNVNSFQFHTKHKANMKCYTVNKSAADRMKGNCQQNMQAALPQFMAIQPWPDAIRSKNQHPSCEYEHPRILTCKADMTTDCWDFRSQRRFKRGGPDGNQRLRSDRFKTFVHQSRFITRGCQWHKPHSAILHQLRRMRGQPLNYKR